MFLFTQHVAHLKLVMGHRVHAIANASVTLTISQFQPAR